MTGEAPIRKHLFGWWFQVLSVLVPYDQRRAWFEEWSGEVGNTRVGRFNVRRTVDVAFGAYRDAQDLRRHERAMRPSRKGDPLFQQLFSDIRFGLRLLRRAPMFTIVVVITLTLGVGATTSIFTVVNSLLLNPLPYPSADRLVNLWQSRVTMGIDRDWFSPAQFVDIREGTDVFDVLTVSIGRAISMTEPGTPRRIGFVQTTAEFLQMFGARPALGRMINESDGVEGSPTVVVLMHSLWQSAFGGDSAIIGKTVSLGTSSLEVVGVLEESFRFTPEVLNGVASPSSVDLFISFRLTDQLLANRGSENYNLVGRLKPGVSIETARAQLDGVARHIIENFEENPASDFAISIVPILDDIVGSVKRPLVALLAAAFVLLIVACANVVNLLLARSDVRFRELAVRAALGAERGRLVRQLLTESALLAFMGGVGGVGFALLSLRGIQRWGQQSLPRLDQLGLDGTVLAFALAIVGIVTLAFGVAPAVRLSRVDVAPTMRLNARGTLGNRSLWSTFNLSSGLVVAEVGLAVILMIGGGLLVRSFRAVTSVDPGFGADNLLTLSVQLLGERFNDEGERVAFMNEVEDRTRAIPGVVHAGGVHVLPFGPGVTWGALNVRGQEASDVIVHYRIVTPSYLAAMGISVVRGRGFDARDHADSPGVVLIDQRLAERAFGEGDPLGQQIEGWSTDWAEVIGVVSPIHSSSLESESTFMAYYPYSQIPSSQMFLTVRAAVDIASIVSAVRSVIAEVDENVLVADVMPMRERIDDSLASRRLAMLLFQAFAGIAALLAAIGVYGLIGYRVAQGTRELGMRMALGASGRSITGLVLRHGASLGVIGIVLGIAGSLGVTRLMSSMLFGVAPLDPITYLGVGTGIVLLIGLACFLPASRAGRVDPMESLKE